MSDPATKEEYLALFDANTLVDGYGTEVAMHSPCPWCAAAEFLVLHPAWGILDDRPNIDAQMEAETECGECGRSGRSVVSRGPEGVSFEFVQTGGPDAPAWLVPPPRRIA